MTPQQEKLAKQYMEYVSTYEGRKITLQEAFRHVFSEEKHKSNNNTFTKVKDSDITS